MATMMPRLLSQFGKQYRLFFKLAGALLLSLSLAGTSNAGDKATPLTRQLNFSITAQPLSPALLVYSRITGISLLVAKKELAGHNTQGINGEMSPTAALQVLLAGSGLGFKFIDSQTVSLSRAHFEDQAKSSDTPPTNEAIPIPDDIPRIEETIVSARRRNEQLQKVPIPVSVLDSKLLHSADILNLQDVAQRVPGLNVSYFSIGQPSIHMRGIGSNDDGAALDNSVVIFVDDIYVGRISTIDINVLDLDRIEVLRGPQGTLYGKNAIGGAVNMVSALPTRTAGKALSASAGNLGYGSITGKLNGPLFSNTLLGRLSVSSRQRDGWQNNIVLGGNKQHDDKNTSLRAKLLYSPRDDLDWYLAYDFSKDELNSTGRIPVVGRVPLTLAANQGIPLLSNNQESSPPQFELPTDIFKALGGDPQHATNGTSGYTQRNIGGLTSRVNLEHENYLLTSITGYRNSDFQWLEDSTGLPANVISLPISDYVDETHKQFSQELRWSSADRAGLNYVLGMYYLTEQTDRKEHFLIGETTARTHQKNTSKSFAVFGEASYQISEASKLTLGARYTYDSKELRQQSWNGGSPAIILENFKLDSSANWQDVSPSASLSYQANDDIMLFARVARGFKNGGFQGAPSTREAAMREIDPETAWDFELGLKSRWYQNRLQLNLTGFYTRYRDLQVTQFKTVDNFGVFETSNAGSANLKGLETEFIFNASENLELSGNYAWLDARYDQFNDVEGRDFSGNRLRQAPENSLNIAARYRWVLNPGNVGLRLDYRYQSRSYQEPDNSVTVLPAFDLLDAKMTYTPNNSNWNFSLWAKNLLDEEYITHLYLLGGNDYALFGTPRTIGVSLSYSSL